MDIYQLTIRIDFIILPYFLFIQLVALFLQTLDTKQISCGHFNLGSSLFFRLYGEVSIRGMDLFTLLT